MMNGASQPAASGPSTPIWAPDPGVPLIARLLAYTFAALMLLTVILSLVTHRPPDIPPVPKAWRTYVSPNRTLSLPYPDGWTVADTQKNGNVQFTCMLLPGGPVEINGELVTLDKELPPHAVQDARFHAMMETGLRKRFPAYTPTPHDDTWHTFTFQPPGADRLHGGWVICSSGRQLVILIATAPPKAWPVMEFILTHMTEHLELKR